MAEDTPQTEGPSNGEGSSISLNPFAIQLVNVVPIEIVARRFPVESNDTNININLNVVGISIDSDSQQAQVILEMKLEPSQEPRFFEIFFRIVGLFSYSLEYDPTEVHEFLQQGSLSILLPFVRELVLNFSTRLQIPPIMLSLVQLTPQLNINKKDHIDEPAPENA